MQLAGDFEEIDHTYGPVPIWWWSGAPLRRERLSWQMRQLHAQGVRQAIIMCLAPRGPLFGSVADDPPFLSEPWWKVFGEACEDAHQIGFKFWLYDQLGFSGANFQGQVVTAEPRFAGWQLGRHSVHTDGDEITVRAPGDATALAAYALPDDGGPAVPLPLRAGAAVWTGPAAEVCVAHTTRRGFDYHSSQACEALFDMVLGEFERRAQKWFGSVITGLFQDELPNMPSWSAAFAETFEQEYGYDLLSEIAHLWHDAGPRGLAVRRDYHRHRARLATDAFFAPLAGWANRWGLTSGFDQQSPAREGDPTGGVALYGDYLSTHSGFTAPGSDHWGDPKIHSSLAHAGHQPRTWLEAFHSSGWGGTLEETYDWLGPFLRRGANLYDPHAVYYATVGGWWEWAAPSTCWRQPYWDTYRPFAEAVTRLCRLLSSGSLVCDTVLLHPTVTVQAELTLDGVLDGGRHAADTYHRLNGATSWFSEQPGILDRAGHDYEIFDESVLARGTTSGGVLRVAGGAFRNIVLPAVSVLDNATATALVAFANGGGRVVCVGTAPATVLDDPGLEATTALRQAVDTQRITVVAAADDVPAQLLRGPVTVEADAPVMVRRNGDALVLMFVAHDERSGTQAPILPGHRNLDWVSDSFRWDRYWTQLGERGYTYLPAGDRRIHARVDGVPAMRAQRWDPRTGDRTDLAVRAGDDGLHLELGFDDKLGFDDGAMTVVMLAPHLPDATRRDPGPRTATTPVGGPWRIEARSTADNRWGDLAGPRHPGIVPLQVWQFEHSTATDDRAPSGNWKRVYPGFGPYVQIQPAQPGPAPGVGQGWQPWDYSLSHGIRKDALHFEYLGPKGMVPEEFLAWPEALDGQWVAVRTRLHLPAGTGRSLSVGANAGRRILLDGREASADGEGYWSLTALPDTAGPVLVEVWLRAEIDADDPGPTTGVRASFAVVTDADAYHRPEWLTTADGGVPDTTVEFVKVWHLDSVPAEAVLQVAAEGPCTLLVNGREIGRQGAFDPYTAVRAVKVLPYDVRDALRPGDNVVTLRLSDTRRRVAVLVDGSPRLATDATWCGTRDGTPVGTALRREQWTDPRWVCLRARPHPLRRAAWLDSAADGTGVVLDLVPEVPDLDGRPQWLRFPAPAGAVEFTVDSPLPYTVEVAGRTLMPVQGRVRLPHPLPGGTTVYLRFQEPGGRHGGSLLDGPVEVRTAAVDAELLPWADLGLRSLAGSVTYSTEVHVGDAAGDRTVLDLGDVRGTAEVRLNGRPAGIAVVGPYRLDVTGLLRAGVNQLEIIVRGTLAGYLDDVSPTPAIAAGQTRTGLFGPVRLHHHDSVPA